ncbi:hypothetical protein HMPREF0239_00420 [Clostridium sp. ATCC BAA-442]|nr:hypothetical protein HMPREF0239_00420 [Clostridium sp. ATCC BAA-442]
MSLDVFITSIVINFGISCSAISSGSTLIINSTLFSGLFGTLFSFCSLLETGSSSLWATSELFWEDVQATQRKETETAKTRIKIIFIFMSAPINLF